MWQRLFDSWHALDLPLPLFCGDAVIKVISVFDVIRVSVWRGGRKGGPKTAKPHRNTPKNCKPHRIFSQIPKPRVHVGHNTKADVSKT